MNAVKLLKLNHDLKSDETLAQVVTVFRSKVNATHNLYK